MTRVLLADDHFFILAGVEAVLRDSEFEVVAKVRDGAAVFPAMQATRPDILVLDVRMPERDGVDVLMTLRGRGDKRPVVLLTASLDDRLLLEAVKAGVNGIVLKEGAEEVLLKCLVKVRNGGRWIDETLLQKALDLSIGGDSSGEPLHALTRRERRIAGLVAQGLRNKEVAAELGITEGTVKVYLHGIYGKLGIENRTELAVLAADGKSA
jgi:two-component system nitrate/nitrite response regulator NarL